MMRQRATEEEQADMDARRRSARQSADKLLRKARDDAFGRLSLFEEGLPVASSVSAGGGAPVAPALLEVSALRGLPGGDAKGAWAHLRASCGEEFRLGGLRNAGRACFANALLQVLLRLPAVALWLSHHAGACDALPCCLACTLWRSREAFGQRPAAVPALVVGFRGFPGLELFGDGAQHDVAEFCGCLLDALRDGEVAAGRFADWPGVGLGANKVSNVERLFGFVLEQRSRCVACGDFAATVVRHDGDRVLRLPVPAFKERDRVWTTTELYYARAAPSEAQLGCQRCGSLTAHREQTRLLTQPNVLLLLVQRRGQGGTMFSSRKRC